MKEFNLSDKIVDLPKEIIIDYKTKEIHFPCDTNVLGKGDVKEFIKRLKENCPNYTFCASENHDSSFYDEIDKLSGEKLI